MQNNPRTSQNPTPQKAGAADFRSESELMEKVAILQREFADIDINHDTWISRQELYTYLDRRSGGQFDRGIADEIFERMDKDQNGRVTINEFIKVYIEADEMLRKKIESAKINKESYKRQQEECLRKAQEEQRNEKLTAYNIAHNSIVHVTVLAATNLGQAAGRRPPTNPYVEVSFNDQEIVKSKIASGGVNVEWNEKITFDVVNPESFLKFTLFDSRIPTGDTFEGYLVVELGDLRDQNQHDVVLDLLSENGQPGRGQLHLKLQWIHSKAKYFSMIAQKWQENYLREDEELREYERYLQTLYQPFPGLRTIQRMSVRNPEPTAINLPDTSNLDNHFLQLMNKAARKIAKQENPNESFWVYIATAGCIVELVMAIFISFGRPSFFDLIYPSIILLYLKGGLLRELTSLKVVALIILASVIFFDIVWIGLYSGHWTDAGTNDVEAEGGTRGFVIFMSFINIIVKVILAMLCYMVDLQIVKQRASVPRSVLREGSPPRQNIPIR